jgi:hypothetical protein
MVSDFSSEFVVFFEKFFRATPQRFEERQKEGKGGMRNIWCYAISLTNIWRYFVLVLHQLPYFLTVVKDSANPRR